MKLTEYFDQVSRDSFYFIIQDFNLNRSISWYINCIRQHLPHLGLVILMGRGF